MEAILIGAIVVAFGMVLIYLARIAKHQHNELKGRGITEWSATRQPRSIREAMTLLLFGPQPKFLEVVGRTLAVLVTLFVVVVVVGVLAAIAIVKLKS
jgi:hypothetical protein